MSLIMLVLVVALVGFLLWLVQEYVPMAPPFKIILQVIIVVALVLWLLQGFGVVGPVLRFK